MERIRLGILGTSEIAFRRFLPALHKSENFEYFGVASRDVDKTVRFTEQYGGIGIDGYEALLNDERVDAVYIPLPPALHYEWGKKALLAGKHVMLEKPFSTNDADTGKLIRLARKQGLAIHENYMFRYHSQVAAIMAMVGDGTIGDIRLYRMAFGFPIRGANDFRYDRAMGGGALLDCGGYPLALATMLLGDTAQITAYQPGYDSGWNVDLYGSATLTNALGVTAQIAFGMDCGYKCDLEIWGSKGQIWTNRIFTAPEGYEPVVTVTVGADTREIKLPSDSAFLNSIKLFEALICSPALRENEYSTVLRQSSLVAECQRRQIV